MRGINVRIMRAGAEGSRYILQWIASLPHSDAKLSFENNVFLNRLAKISVDEILQ
jgi:hypothetical protein